MAGVGQEGCQMEANVLGSLLMLFFGKRMCQCAIPVEESLGRSRKAFLSLGFSSRCVVLQSFLNCASAEMQVFVSV